MTNILLKIFIKLADKVFVKTNRSIIYVSR